MTITTIKTRQWRVDACAPSLGGGEPHSGVFDKAATALHAASMAAQAWPDADIKITETVTSVSRSVIYHHTPQPIPGGASPIKGSVAPPDDCRDRHGDNRHGQSPAPGREGRGNHAPARLAPHAASPQTTAPAAQPPRGRTPARSVSEDAKVRTGLSTGSDQSRLIACGLLSADATTAIIDRLTRDIETRCTDMARAWRAGGGRA